MISAASLKAAVESALSLTLSGPYSARAKPTDLYEAAMFTMMLRAAEHAGGTVFVTNDGLNSAVDARFRTSPGILSASSEYTYAVVTFPATPTRHAQRVEVHLGIRFSGRSGICHECDIAMLTGAEADRVRAGRRSFPSSRALITAVEAKLLTRGPGLEDGRNLLGLGTEFRLQKCRLVAPNSGAASLRRLFAYWPCQLSENLIPGTAEALKLEDDLRETILEWLSRRRRRQL
ncbi:hypothetical protein NG2371_05977 [Nocardia gamkensis]|nr:hypothetical protein [Nocardia gamkensis]